GLTCLPSGMLDRHAGIDWLVSDGSGVTTVASRVQYLGTPYETFTIGRAEMAKRLRFADASDGSSSLGPIHTVQAYVRQRGKGPFLLGMTVLTADVYAFVRDHPECVTWRRGRRTGKEFGVVWVDCLTDEGVDVTTVASDDLRAFRTRDGLNLMKDI